jgi:hypothetical protein
VDLVVARDLQRIRTSQVRRAVLNFCVIREGAARGPSIETELVALNVLHREARLVVAIGRH